MCGTRLTQDWKKTTAVVVAPEIWSLYRQKPHDLSPTYLEIVAVLRSFNIAVHILTARQSPIDIWVRDWGCVEGHFFLYQPSYAKNLYSRVKIARARGALAKKMGATCQTIPIVLDGGNLIHNGKVAIVTEKALQDNVHLSRAEVERGIKSIGLEHVVFIPVEPGDSIGHVDGVLRFASPDMLLVNDYEHSHLAGYGRRLRKVLRAALPSVTVVDFPWFAVDEMVDGVYSAVGCYINFIHTAKGIIYPVFAHPLDEEVAVVLAEVSTLPRCSVYSTPLARLGGVLNCIVCT